MAAKTFYFKNAAASGSSARSLQDGGSVTAATTGTGWTTENAANAGLYSLMVSGSEATRTGPGSFTGTAQPTASLASNATDCWRTENAITGTFANANWSLKFGFRAVTANHSGNLNIRFRVWKSANADGSSATELTSAAQASGNFSTSTGSDSTVTVTWSPGGTITLTNEYLFVQCAIYVVSNGGNSSSDCLFRVDSSSGYAVTTSDFTPPSSAPPPFHLVLCFP